jgi:ribonuclease-3
MQTLQSRIGYMFSNGKLLELALTHPSLKKNDNNQRLEFLGDAVLGMVIAKLLYELFPQEQEGELARRHAALVRAETLVKIARELALGERLLMASGEIQSGGRDNASNLEDALEALIGALYLDGGMQAAEQFILPRWTEIARNIKAPPKDAKTALQEWAQARGLPVPNYEILGKTGLAHAPEFTIEVTVEGYPPVQAKAPTKRAAEQEAAGLLFEQLIGTD